MKYLNLEKIVKDNKKQTRSLFAQAMLAEGARGNAELQEVAQLNPDTIDKQFENVQVLYEDPPEQEQ